MVSRPRPCWISGRSQAAGGKRLRAPLPKIKTSAGKVVNSAKNEILASGKRATLNVDRKNPVSYHLYLSLGFERMFSQGEFRRVE